MNRRFFIKLLSALPLVGCLCKAEAELPPELSPDPDWPTTWDMSEMPNGGAKRRIGTKYLPYRTTWPKAKGLVAI